MTHPAPRAALNLDHQFSQAPARDSTRPESARSGAGMIRTLERDKDIAQDRFDSQDPRLYLLGWGFASRMFLDHGGNFGPHLVPLSSGLGECDDGPVIPW